MKAHRFQARLPIIDPAAVEAYLSRPLDSFDELKQVTHEELAAEARELGFRFVTEPRTHQLVSCLIGVIEPAFLFFLDMGAGKSKVPLDLIRYRKKRGELHRALILAPELIHMYSWEEQLKQHAPDLSYVLLLGEREERLSLVNRKSDICLMNYKGLEVYMSRRVKLTKGGRQHLDPDAAGRFASQFNFLVLDESHRLGNHQALVYKLCSWLSSACTFRYALTGSPFGRDPMKLWPQFQLIDQGATLGLLGLFRSAFFHAKVNYWGGIDYTFRTERKIDLHRIIKHRSLRLEIKLSEKPDYIRIPVRLSGEGKMFYERIIKRLAESKGDYRSLENSFVRMRQCASGFLSMKADDESRIEVRIEPNPKLEALRQFLLDLDEGEKFLIFHDFITSGNNIRRLLDEMKIGYASLYGGVKDVEGQYRRFLTEPKCRAFVLQSQTGSEAINPQGVCRYALFYESPIDSIRRTQAEKRVHRPGQQRKVFIYDFVMQGTVEEKILVYIDQGKDLLRAVLNGEERLI